MLAFEPVAEVSRRDVRKMELGILTAHCEDCIAIMKFLETGV